MALEARYWTRADLDQLPDEDGVHYEVIDGELYVMPASMPPHERSIMVLADRLRAYVKEQALGEVYNGRPAFVEGDNQVEPDLIVTDVPRPFPKSWEDMPRPLLVVEVVSPSNERHDKVTKRRLYHRAGIVDYWIVDGAQRTIQVVTEAGDRTETETLRWHPEGASAPLEIDLHGLFDEALGPE